ncbi:MAG: hypothetical protein QME59_05425 [Candidatus Hydrothermarchaeota archaeon]|nr:hypothetical protein [Candidatus Hydrothermarchaeota archaeon]
MEVTLNKIYKELLLLKKEVAALRESIFVEEVEPLEDEAKSIKEYEKRKRAGDIEFSVLEEV